MKLLPIFDNYFSKNSQHLTKQKRISKLVYEKKLFQRN